jgi:chromosome segregation ATPase
MKLTLSSFFFLVWLAYNPIKQEEAAPGWASAYFSGWKSGRDQTRFLQPLLSAVDIIFLCVANMDPKAQRQIGERIAQLQTKGDICSRSMLMEQRRVEELDQALQQASAQIMEYRKKTKQAAVEVLNLHQTTANPAHQRADGLNPTKQADINQKKMVANLECRLDKLKVRHSEVENASAEMKRRIDHMRTERVTADCVHQQYETRIREARARITDFMEQSARLNEQVESLTKERNELLAANDEEQGEFEAHIEEVDKMIADENFKFEQSVKEAANRSKAFGDFSDLEKAGDYTVEEEEEIADQIRRVAEEKANSDASAAAVEKKIAWYKSSFEELKRVSGIDDLDRLIQVFQKQEEQNFSLYNYIQAVSQEVDQQVEKTEELENEIAEYEAEQGVEEEQRVAVVNQLKSSLEQHSKASREWEAKAHEAAHTADRIAKRVQSIFFKIQCDHYLQTVLKEANAEELSGLETMASLLSGQGITESTVLQFMSLVERRAVNIISQYAHRQAAIDPAGATLSGPSRPPSWETSESTIRPPPLDDDESEGLDECATGPERPIDISQTRLEISAKIARSTLQHASTKKKVNTSSNASKNGRQSFAKR